MANQKQAATKRLKMSERAQQQLDLHFPEFPPQWLWRRKTNDGFTTLPRTLPLVMQAVDAQSKGQPAGHTLFCLWARSPDNPLVTIENPATFASEAGFDGERAVDTWRRRMKRLHTLKLIAPKRGPSGDFHYVLLLNPNVAMEDMRRNGLIQDGLYARFIDRLAEVGGYGELDAIRAFWQDQQLAQTAVMATAEAQAQSAVGQAITLNAPPPPPASGSGASDRSTPASAARG
ncbi:hypothetical protein SAMN05421829_101140 [Aromatoleum tolulyticum]|uniref:Uncharacterized protein n=1 Tax=Aromatoleum tolulyticum TaxID=34027 RepID=A0A1N6N7B6_9RHOO|nr:hypothetical protein [Aromatoleum tolulyticum]SIP87968.1 hypothetical protein SAMN05421829_101140 [Aromatoleum tolulyticum]